jgi:hypothetical protein
VGIRDTPRRHVENPQKISSNQIMRRDILAGCVGLGITMLFFICNQHKTPYKKVEYSPLIHKPVIPDMSDKKIIIHPASGDIFTATTSEEKTMNAYQVPELNRLDTISTEELMQLPLESAGDFLNEQTTSEKQALFVKYVRFQITEVRDSDQVHVGGFRFLYNDTPVPFEKIQQWNPHTGDSKQYGGEVWSDSDQLSVIFCFSEPLEISHYELKSSYESEEHDPVQWKVEGSMNGSFWFILDDRTMTATAFPKMRNRVALYLMRP